MLTTSTTPSLRRIASLAVALAALSTAMPARGDDPPPTKPVAPGQDEVVLTDGSRVRGSISVEDPKTGITIVLPNGTVRQIKASDVKRTVYGGGLASAAPPPAVVPAAAAPPAVVGAPSYDSAAAPPPVARRSGGSLRGLWIPSLVLLTTTYVATVITTSVMNATLYHDPDWATSGYAAIPLAGPWIIFGTHGDSIRDSTKALLITSGIVQTLSATGLIVGLSVTTDGGSAQASSPRWAVVPTIGPNQAGLTFTYTGF